MRQNNNLKIACNELGVLLNIAVEKMFYLFNKKLIEENKEQVLNEKKKSYKLVKGSRK